MKSQTLPAFWEKYERLDESLKKQARKALALKAEFLQRIASRNGQQRILTDSKSAFRL